MLEIIKQFVRRMLMGKGKGILQIAPKKDVDKFAKELFKKFKQDGIPDSGWIHVSFKIDGNNRKECLIKDKSGYKVWQ